MNPIVEIVEAAEREVLAHTIESTRGLRAYLCLSGSEEELGPLQERQFGVVFTATWVSAMPRCWGPHYAVLAGASCRGGSKQKMRSSSTSGGRQRYSCAFGTSIW